MPERERERERGGVEGHLYQADLYLGSHEITPLRKHLFGVMATLLEIFEKVCRS